MLLFCIKLNFMITLIALFMSLSCYYARLFLSESVKLWKLKLFMHVSYNVRSPLDSKRSVMDPAALQWRKSVSISSDKSRIFPSTLRFSAIHFTSLHKIAMPNRVCNHQITSPYKWCMLDGYVRRDETRTGSLKSRTLNDLENLYLLMRIFWGICPMNVVNKNLRLQLFKLAFKTFICECFWPKNQKCGSKT